MPMEWEHNLMLAAADGATDFWGDPSPLFVSLLVILGILIGLIVGFLYSYAKTKFSNTEADRKIRRIMANFEQEKDTSESILRELQVGILAYGGDGRLVTGNPSANAILEMEKSPPTLQSFLTLYGSDNGIQAAFVLQTPNITGIVCVNDRTVRLRLTQTQLAPYHKPGWIIIIQDISEQEREEQQRKEFVANVSHELKTPLTTISAYSETLLDWGLEGKSVIDIRSDILRIHDDATRMDNLVQNLLLLSSIDSRGLRPKMMQYDIVSVMKQVVARMQVQANEKSIQLESSVLSIIPPVYGDASALDRILTNLVSNGIKYTDQHGYVSVSVQLTNEYISLKVKDNGMGVAKDNLQRLFDRFYRVDATGSRKHGGTGLGLSIVKELTEMQGGTISVMSVLGKGTEFFVTVPKAEKTYRETLTAIFDGSPRREILYENAQVFLQSAAEEIDIPVQDLSQLSRPQIEDLMSYLLAMPDMNELDYSIVAPADQLPVRYETAKRVASREKVVPAPMPNPAPILAKPPVAVPVSRPNEPLVNQKPSVASAAIHPQLRNVGTGSTARTAPVPTPVSNAQAVSRPSVKRPPANIAGSEIDFTNEANSMRSAGDKPIQRNPTSSVRNTLSQQTVTDRLVKAQVKNDDRLPLDRTNKLKLPKTAEETKIITIDHLHASKRKGEHHA
jgi:two-component system phosphate regulon sensor histidine kinase PhoR